MLEIGVKVDPDETPPDNSGMYELVDLTVYLDPNVLKIMYRNGGGKF